MLFTPEERRALLALSALLLLGQAVSFWEDHRRGRPDRELSDWLTKLAHARSDSGLVAEGEPLAMGAALVPGGGIPGSAFRTAPDSVLAGGSSVQAAGEGADSEEVVKDVPLQPLAALPAGLLESGRVRINLATAADLEGLPGIGPALARRILDERSRAGPFRKPEDLRRVSGIGPKKLAALIPRIDLSVGGPGLEGGHAAGSRATGSGATGSSLPDSAPAIGQSASRPGVGGKTETPSSR
jgi:competence ComEA-like helix-hairpin-helix protein